MGMLATIAIMNDDGTADAVYANWITDYQVEILLKRYASKSKVRSLINKGSISRLGPNLGKRHPFDDDDRLYADQCTFYHRDRGDELEIYRGLTTISELQNVASGPVYVFRDGTWWTLSDSLTGDKWIVATAESD
jgi:hypothetical protein